MQTQQRGGSRRLRVWLWFGVGAAALAGDMRAYGLDVSVRDLNSGLAMMLIGPEGLSGAADPRREGVALGE